MVVKLPQMKFDSVDAVLKFYKALGWDGKMNLNPSKVVISKFDWTRIYSDLMASAEVQDEKVGLSLFWMNYGPSASEDVIIGEVVLNDGWVD